MRSLRLRPLFTHALRGAVVLAAVAMLTGAKANCGGSDSESTSGTSSGDTGLVCGDGQHEETVCDGMGSCDPAGCHEACIPDVCPDGVQPQYVCTDPGGPPEPGTTGSGYATPADDGAVGTTTGGATGGCGYVCGPIPACGRGYHEEQVCSGSASVGVTTGGMDVGTGAGAGAPSSGGGSEPYPGDCYTECVPDSTCPPGTIEQGGCDGSDGSAPDDPTTCWSECVPVCDDGSMPTTVCAPPDPGGNPSPDYCWQECGGSTTTSVVASSGTGAEPDACPPGQHQEQQCWMGDSTGGCDVTCVDDQ